MPEHTTLVLVRKKGALFAHFVRADDFDQPGGQRTDNAASAFCGEMGLRAEPWLPLPPDAEVRVCQYCHAHACRRRAHVVRRPVTARDGYTMLHADLVGAKQTSLFPRENA